jgi:transcriptional regulator with XRE-family HTH domain
MPGWVQGALQAALARRLVSRRELARELGISDRSVRRWLAGARRLAPDHLVALEVAVARRLEAIAAEAGHPTGVGEYTLRAARGREEDT